MGLLVDRSCSCGLWHRQAEPLPVAYGISARLAGCADRNTETKHMASVGTECRYGVVLVAPGVSVAHVERNCQERAAACGAPGLSLSPPDSGFRRPPRGLRVRFGLWRFTITSGWRVGSSALPSASAFVQILRDTSPTYLDSVIRKS